MIVFDKRILTHFDFIQIILIIPIIILSNLLVCEASGTLAFKQYLYYSLGAAVFLLFFILPIKRAIWVIPLIYWLNVAMLLSVEFLGVSKLGAQRWLEIPFTNLTFQPSEIMKPAFILMLAYTIRENPPQSGGYGVKDFLKFSFLILLPFVLILKEPDLGSALLLFLTGYGILFVVGVNRRIWLTILFCSVVASPLLYQNLHQYQKKRIIDFISKEPSYHVKQSIIAIGNGGMSGKSKDEATQTHFKFLPIATSDFIFAYLIERHGFLGGFFLMGIYALLILHILLLNYKLKGDYLAQVTATGIAILLFIYIGVNISMTIGFAPVVGIPLPFFSYGGSSFVTFAALFGILQHLVTFRFDPTNKMLQIKF
ncbi:FtsW/RodA/SpoVE family cell cycle protein [uncultured Campylobacter sp.]|uniref:FtsW/RodA/SpoVE family cell cycle protein n=1 Tax=uncultured Campylobacter sp. TaxID=218934 RepID=UPI002614B373|nr:FtsW/RodA/SpoVE family cell cycle protein [uncultured Campylobacter sp.]